MIAKSISMPQEFLIQRMPQDINKNLPTNPIQF